MRLEVPVAQGVQGVPQVPQCCFLEYQEFQGCPVAPGDLVALGDQGAPALTSFSLQREKEILQLIYTCYTEPRDTKYK